MADDSPGFDPYEAVLADLRAKREQIDQAITAIESLRGGVSVKAVTPLPAAPTEGPGAFLGMTIVEASKALLKAKRQPLKNADLVVGLQAGGLVMQSADPINTVGSVLTRRFNEVGDVVRVARGTWGLKDWYPNRNFKKETGKGDDNKVAESFPPPPPPPPPAPPSTSPAPPPFFHQPANADQHGWGAPPDWVKKK